MPGNTYVGLISVAGRLLSRLRDLILVPCPNPILEFDSFCIYLFSVPLCDAHTLTHTHCQVCAVDICMRYRLVERAPKGMRATLVKLWRYGCELGSICSEALHEVLLFRYG
ncbi:MAG: hypothetical protein ACPIOQ_28175 [Promethearchaeia archaeon]